VPKRLFSLSPILFSEFKFKFNYYVPHNKFNNKWGLVPEFVPPVLQFLMPSAYKRLPLKHKPNENTFTLNEIASENENLKL
jgi:hypothetical protein